MPRRSLIHLFVAAVTTAAMLAIPGATRAEANTISFSTPIPDHGHVDWSTYGAEFDTVLNGVTKAVPGIPGLNLTVSQQTGFDFLRVAEGSTWLGNFATGDPLLYTTGGGPIDFLFSAPVAAFGSQIQSAIYGAFSARLEAFDAGGNLLGSFLRAGNSTGAEDNSAIFLGLGSDTANITRVRLSLTSAQPDSFGLVNLGDFAVSNPRISETPVPEPVSLALFGTGLALIAARQRARRLSRR